MKCLASAWKNFTVPKDSSAYQTGMMDIKEAAKELLRKYYGCNSFLYVSPSNILFSTSLDCSNYWNLCCSRKEEQLKETDESGV